MQAVLDKPPVVQMPDQPARKAAEAPEPGEQARKAHYVPHRPALAAAIAHELVDGLSDNEFNALLRRAGARFADENPEAAVLINVDYGVKSVMERLLTHGHLADAPRSGRPQTLEDRQVDSVLCKFLKGMGIVRLKTWWGYTSLAHAIAQNAEIAEAAQSGGVTTDTWWRRMKERHQELYHRPLKKMTVQIKPKLTAEVKQERVLKSNEWLRREQAAPWLHSAVWIDEKKEWMRGGGQYRCYGPCDMGSYQVESEEPLGKSQWVKYEAAVSAWGGPLYLELITGTYGLKSQYQVRRLAPSFQHGDTLTHPRPSRAAQAASSTCSMMGPSVWCSLST